MFIEEYLEDLRRERFAPHAVAAYARRVAARLREHIYANPGAVRSVWSTALGFFAAAFLAAVAIALGWDRHLAHDFFLYTSIWILLVFGLVTLNIDLMRDRGGFALSALNVPTAITLLRVTLVPGLVLLLLDRRFALALATFLLAGLSDVLDGWIARRWKQESGLGIVLDPIVDIVFNLAVFLALAAAGLVPRWVLGVATLRYGLVLVGGTCVSLFVGPLRIRPTFFGRATGVVMSALVALLVLLHSLPGRVAEVLTPLTQVALGVLLSATVIHVIVLGWYNLRLLTGEAVRARGRVVGDVRWGPQ